MNQAIALNRFGLGARPGDSAVDDPKKALTDQFDRYEPRPAAIAQAPSRAQIAQNLTGLIAPGRAMAAGEARTAPGRPDIEDETPQERAERRARNAAAREAGETGASPAASGRRAAPKMNSEARQAALVPVRRAERGFFLDCVTARTASALTTPAPFVERLVHFWANHFAVSTDKRMVYGMAGLMEFEAIRPHVLGKFGDMLAAVERHPAMLFYLDQMHSIGPSSEAGQRAKGAKNIGFNENLAREIFELHTLGVRNGYSQTDVTEFARALTGWTVGGLAYGPPAQLIGRNGPLGQFQFAGQVHEPGARTILGKQYAQQGEAQGQAVLQDLAVHPATAKHVMTKLARHFTADQPPQPLVDALVAAFLKSGGDLPTVYRTLIESDAAWSPSAAKFKSPWEWTISAWRALGTQAVEGQQVANLLNQLGQPVWRPGSPAGYDDLAATWAGPDALMRRVEVAERLAGRAETVGSPQELAAKILPGATGDRTNQAIARADSPAQGLAMLLVAPEFLRR